MSKLLTKIIDSTAQKPTLKNVSYLIQTLEKSSFGSGQLELEKSKLVEIAGTLWELGEFGIASSLMEAIATKFSNDRRLMLYYANFLSRSYSFDKAIHVASEVLERPQSILEEIRALDALIRAKSSMLKMWDECRESLIKLKDKIQFFIESDEEVDTETLVMLTLCSFWLSGYFSDDLEDLSLAQRNSQFFRSKVSSYLRENLTPEF